MQQLGELVADRRRLALVAQALLAELLLGVLGGVRVEAEQHLSVAQRVLLLDAGALRGGVALGLLEHGLHLGAVDQAGDVGVADEVGGQEEVLLQGRGFTGRAVDGVEGLECARGPDDEATQVAAGRELEQVQREHRRRLDAGDVAECAHKLLAVRLRVVHDERSAALAVAAVSQLSLTGTQLARLLHLDDVRASTDGLQESGGGGGLDERGTLEGLARHNERHFGHGGDAVTTGEEEGGDGAGGDGRGSSEAPAKRVLLAVFLSFSVSTYRDNLSSTYFCPWLIF